MFPVDLTDVANVRTMDELNFERKTMKNPLKFVGDDQIELFRLFEERLKIIVIFVLNG